MPQSPFETAGAAIDPGNSAPLTMNRYITGLWTQRSLLRDAATPFLYEKFYSASRFDSMSGGENVELSVRLTIARAPGSTEYNSQIFEEIDDFYEFRTTVENQEIIHVMADTAGVVYDATGPDTKLNIWNKSAGAGQTFFLGVGNTLYMGNGVDTKKWILSNLLWHANTLYNAKDFIVDPNHNIQMAVGGFTVGVTSVKIAGNVLTVTLDATDSELPFDLNLLVGVKLAFGGLTGAAFLNGQIVQMTGTIPSGNGAAQFTANFVHADYPDTPDTGTVTSGVGTSGVAAPAWNPNLGGFTSDGAAQWVNRGNWVRNWGIAAPKSAPTVSQTPAASTTPPWIPNTYYSTSFLITQGGFIFKVTTFGTTGNTIPAFDTTTGNPTADGSVVWTCQGPADYAASTAYAAGAYVLATVGTAQYFFQAANAGNSGASTPAFSSVLGSRANDNGITWTNVGIKQTWSDVTSTSFSGNFGYIPLHGGGTLIIGAGAGANGSTIGLPTGYSAGRMLAWTSPQTGFSGSSAVTEGVYQSPNAAVLDSSFQGNFGGFAFSASSNWAAAAWTDGAEVTLGSLGGFQTLTVTTAKGDTIVLVCGTLAHGATVPVPAGGYLATQFLHICGAASSDNPGHIMQGLSTCSLDATLKLTLTYDDNDGNTWHGNANVFGIFYLTSGGITQTSAGSGTAILVPISETTKLAFSMDVGLAHGATMGLPAGYTVQGTAATVAMNGWTASGSDHGHGWDCHIDAALSIFAQYRDGTHPWNGGANAFAVSAILNSTSISPNQQINDGVGDLQKITRSGLSSASTPAWNTTLGGTTIDNSATWSNIGVQLAATTKPWQWWYSYRSLVDGSESSLSPISQPLQLDAGNAAFLQGEYSTDFQADVVVIYRTAQGQSTPLEEDQIPNNPNGGTWQYLDQNPDSKLNPFIVGAIAPLNAPPPSNFLPMAYHLNRIFGSAANVLRWSGGPDTTTGNGNTAFPSKNQFVYPSTITWCWAASIGLVAFTLSDVQFVGGRGTADSPLYPSGFQQGIGLPTKNVFCVNGSTGYMMTTAKRVISFDPGAGELEVGFPIGDQFTNTFVARDSYLTFHEGSSEDIALYCADGSNGWFRMGMLAAPEQGIVWSPKRNIVGGVRCVKSIEVAPGEKQLLMGVKGGGKILKRDYSIFSDDGVAYPMWCEIGNIVVAQPGSVASIDFVTLDSIKRGTAPTPSLLLNELPNQPATPKYITLQRTGPDLPLQRPSLTIWNNRHDFGQQQKPADCRHLSMRLDWIAEAVQNELLTHTIYGAIRREEVGGKG